MKKLIPWLILGLIIRILLIPIALHPDIRGHNLAAYFISQKNQWLTFYDHLRLLPRNDHLVELYTDGLFIYPPLAYWIHGAFMKVLGWAYPWDTFWMLINDIGRARDQSGFALLMFLLKLPYFVADILGLVIIGKLFSDKQRFWAVILWWFNPITIYSAYLIGQFDIYIAVLILASIYLYSKQKAIFSAICLGLAAGFKPFPLVLIPLLGITLKEKIKLSVIGFATYGLFLLPYLNSTGFKHYALLAQQSDKPFYARVMVSGSQYLPLFLVGLVFMLWANYFNVGKIPIWKWFAGPLLWFYGLSHFHPQWFTWVVPVLILWCIDKPKLWPVFTVVLLTFITIVFSFEPSLNFGLFNINYQLNISDANISIVRAGLLGSIIWLLRELVL